jgi:hypothetical protein
LWNVHLLWKLASFSSSQPRISCAAIFAYDLAVKLESCALADTARGREQLDCATIWASHKLAGTELQEHYM